MASARATASNNCPMILAISLFLCLLYKQQVQAYNVKGASYLRTHVVRTSMSPLSVLYSVCEKGSRSGEREGGPAPPPNPFWESLGPFCVCDRCQCRRRRRRRRRFWMEILLLLLCCCCCVVVVVKTREERTNERVEYIKAALRRNRKSFPQIVPLQLFAFLIEYACLGSRI